MLVVQLLSCVWLFVTPWTASLRSSLSFTISLTLRKLKSIESVRPSNHLVLCHPLLLLPSIFPSIGVFSNELTLHISWPKYWSFSISPSDEYSGFISFRIEQFEILAVQGTLKSLLQHHRFTAICKVENQQVPVVGHREFCSMLCNNQQGQGKWKWSRSVVSGSLRPDGL